MFVPWKCSCFTEKVCYKNCWWQNSLFQTVTDTIKSVSCLRCSLLESLCCRKRLLLKTFGYFIFHVLYIWELFIFPIYAVLDLYSFRPFPQLFTFSFNVFFLFFFFYSSPLFLPSFSFPSYVVIFFTHLLRLWLAYISVISQCCQIYVFFLFIPLCFYSLLLCAISCLPFISFFFSFYLSHFWVIYDH